MTSRAYRLQEGGRIDRSRPLRFTFDGREMQGFAGDTVASAMLAGGARTVARSLKYRRPRGIYSAGAEEPGAIFMIGRDGHHTPNARATLTPLCGGMDVRSQSGWPSARFDLGAPLTSAASGLLPVGFYYKTFMWPPKLWMFYEKFIRRAASGARSPQGADADSYLHRHAHCDVLIAGGGPAGLAAALAAGAAGARVILADMNSEFGGDLLSAGEGDSIDGEPAAEWPACAEARLREMDNVTLLPNTVVQGCHDYNSVIAEENIGKEFSSPGLRRRLWRIRAEQIVVAAGAAERPLVFADNDRPGVMGADAIRTYIRRYGVMPGRDFLFFTNNDSAYRAALAAKEAGARRVEIADVRSDAEGGYWQRRARDAGIVLRAGWGVSAVGMQGSALNVRMERLAPGADFVAEGSSHVSSAYDILGVSGGWTPAAHLFSQARGSLTWDAKIGAFAPDAAHPLNPVRACGAATGAWGLSECLRGGAAAGAAAAESAGFAGGAPPKIESPASPAEHPPLFAPFVAARHPPGRGPAKQFVDFMNDVTAADIMLAAREGYESVEHMKRYTVAGFGTDQGKTGNVNALVLLARARGMAPAEVGHTTFRPQYTPIAFGAVVGAGRRELYAPERTTPMHEWHESHGAIFEDVGEWRRPLCFPRAGESAAAAAARECKTARQSVAMMDASTLGKIDVQGPDAAAFLDMIYANNVGSIAPGRCRYSLMLREDGMVYDDGVAARIAENRFHLTTSTGHAAGVMNWLEEWLQTEWPHLRVFCTSVTEQWAVIALAGPKARETLAPLTDAALGAEDFPFMSMKEARVAGAPARIFRVSFSGELAFEINVPARLGQHVWEQLYASGEAHGICAYGTEVMRMLRAEKGYIIAGQDSDGATSPVDMGLSWMLSKKKADYLGKRSLSRPALTAKGRLQFSGILTDDPQKAIPEGAQLSSSARGAPPFPSEGHVTSSYMSPCMGRSIALAMVRDGFSRRGEAIEAVGMKGERIPARIADPVFWDAKGERRDG